MKNETLYSLIGLLILSFCSSLIGLFFTKNVSFKEALKIMIGSFFLGSTIAYLVHDTTWSSLLKKGCIILSSMFAKPIYDKINERIGTWLDKWITSKVDKVSGTKNVDNTNTE